MKQIPGGVTAAKGFQAASTAAKIKYQNRQDMALLYSEAPCALAGVFTTNLVKAAPVQWDKAVLDSKAPVHAVVINSGIANACTGEEGISSCRSTAQAAARALQIPAESVLVASTGVIGMQLPTQKLMDGVAAMAPALGGELSAGEAASKAIMTTDTKNKEFAVQLVLDGKPVTIGGMCKGSGMIHPNMCTMLSFITTDAAISQELLLAALREDVQDTYNMISVDGDTSTNDTVLLLANGQAQNTPITCKNEAYAAFCQALHAVNEELAKKIAGDGEGCTALFEVTVTGARDKQEARTVSKAVITSNLTKAAIFGHDANWGRILCAMGYSGAQFDPEKVQLAFKSAAGSITILKNGTALDFSEEIAKEILSQPHVTVLADLGQGDAQATAWGCDLTFDYVKINADYRS
ncbi:MAG: bifunctional glutamate N-acetyltransferase/amino-acid acetyltransferase ArgJ [Oscillospiraceae bacterium]